MFGLLLVLTACTPRDIAQGGGYRAAAKPIYSSAAFDTARLDGKWVQVAAFASPPDTGCRPGGAEFGALRATYRLCLSGQEIAGAGQIVPSGPGRFMIEGKGVPQKGARPDWWVLWVDSGYRTMAIGTPSGAFGFILNRGPDLPWDRLVAAKEVFDFNGYDVNKLMVFLK